MWERRDIVRAGAAIIVTMAGWGLIRLLFPSLDYFPPENLVRDLDRSWVVAAGIRKLVMTVYGLVAVVLMAVFFKGVQERWPGRGAAKGLVFGASIGGVWAFGFLTGWAFLGTTLRQEFKNIAVDSIPLAIAGLMIGLAVGREVPKSGHRMPKPWLAVLLVAIGFVAVHALGATLLDDLVGPASALLLVPTNALQIALLAGLGLWAGGMYVILRAWLPFETTWARVAFFAFGVFGHCWTWFHLFIPVIEFAGILHVGLLVGLVGAIGVFAGALSYEWLTRGNPSGVTPAINR
jgi:hypothetical protein